MSNEIADLFAKLGLRPDAASFALGEKLINGVKTALVGLIAYKGLDYIKGSIESVVEEGGKLSDMAQTIGVSAETLQEVGYAAKLSGGSLDSAASLLKKFSKNVQAAGDGNKTARKSLKEVGVDFRDILSGAEPLDGALESIADRFREMPNGPKKVALAMKLFGRSGADLIPLLNEGGDGIKKMRQEYVDLGGELDNKTTGDLEAFGDAQDKLSTAAGGLRKQIVVALLPTLSKLVSRLIEWIKENRKLIAARIAVVLKAIIWAVEKLAQGFGILIQLAEFLAPHWQLLLVLAGSLAIAMGFLSAESIIAAIASAAAWIAAAIPLIAMGAVIAVVALAIEDLWTWINGGDSVLKDLWESFSAWIGDGISNIVKTTVDFITGAFQGFFDWIERKLEWVSNKAHELWDWVTNADGTQEAESDKFMAEHTPEGMLVSGISNLVGRAGDAASSPTGQAALDAVRNFTSFGQYAPQQAAGALASSTGNPVHVKSDIVVNVPPGTDAAGVADALRARLDPWWDEKVREFHGGGR